MARIKTSFSNLTDAQLSVKCSLIITSLTGNANFLNPIPPLTEIQAGLDAFITAPAHMGAGKEQTMIKNKVRVALETLLTDLAMNIQLLSKGDEIALETSGFDLITRRSAVGVLPKPVNFVAKPGDVPGSIKLSMKSIAGAKSYLYEYTNMPVTDNSTWDTTVVSRASTTINDLTSGSQYCFRAVAVGSDPTLVYSDNVSSYVL